MGNRYRDLLNHLKIYMEIYIFHVYLLEPLPELS